MRSMTLPFWDLIGTHSVGAKDVSILLIRSSAILAKEVLGLEARATILTPSVALVSTVPYSKQEGIPALPGK